MKICVPYQQIRSGDAPVDVIINIAMYFTTLYLVFSHCMYKFLEVEAYATLH